MKSTIAALTATIALTLPAYAAGDAENGEKEFRKCKSCHMIASADETIVKGGRTGPNLYGVAGRTAGSQEDFKYSDLMTAAGEKGLEWNEEDFIAYVQEPTDWLKEYTGEDGRAKMTYTVRKEEDAADLWASLSSLGADS